MSILIIEDKPNFSEEDLKAVIKKITNTAFSNMEKVVEEMKDLVILVILSKVFDISEKRGLIQNGILNEYFKSSDNLKLTFDKLREYNTEDEDVVLWEIKISHNI